MCPWRITRVCWDKKKGDVIKMTHRFCNLTRGERGCKSEECVPTQEVWFTAGRHFQENQRRGFTKTPVHTGEDYGMAFVTLDNWSPLSCSAFSSRSSFLLLWDNLPPHLRRSSSSCSTLICSPRSLGDVPSSSSQIRSLLWRLNLS